MSRPKINIDFRLVDEYLQAQCSGSSIAGIIGCHPDTLRKSIEDRYKIGFSEYSAQKKAEGCEVLRKKLWDVAQDGNITMLIWLSKNYLNMTDKTNVNLEFEQLSDDQVNKIIESLLNHE